MNTLEGQRHESLKDTQMIVQLQKLLFNLSFSPAHCNFYCGKINIQTVY